VAVDAATLTRLQDDLVDSERADTELAAQRDEAVGGVGE
jgi:hypothetical protein